MQFLKLSQATKTAVTSCEVVKFCISTSLKCILYLEWSGSEKEMSGWSLKKSGFIVLPRQVFLHTQYKRLNPPPVQIHHFLIRAFMLFCINFHNRPNLVLNQQHRSAPQWSMEAVDVKWIYLSNFLVNCSIVRRLLMVPIGLLRVHVCFRVFINI